MAYAPVFDVPVELGLELVPIVRPHLPDAEREALEDIINEQDGIYLGLPVVDFEGPDAGGVIDSGILIAFDRLAVFSTEDQELDVDLDLVARNLWALRSLVPRGSRFRPLRVRIWDTPAPEILMSC